MGDTLKELRKIIPSENFKQQPNDSKLDLLYLEGKHKINTRDFLAKEYSLNISEEDKDKWLNSYSTFKLFDGQDDNLNTH